MWFEILCGRLEKGWHQLLLGLKSCLYGACLCLKKTCHEYPVCKLMHGVVKSRSVYVFWCRYKSQSLVYEWCLVFCKDRAGEIVDGLPPLHLYVQLPLLNYPTGSVPGALQVHALPTLVLHFVLRHYYLLSPYFQIDNISRLSLLQSTALSRNHTSHADVVKAWETNGSASKSLVNIGTLICGIGRN